MSARSIMFLLLSLVAAGALLSSGGSLLDRLPRLTPAPNDISSGRVLRVVDGDTLEVADRSGQEIRVRLIGIDTPESVRPGVPVECGSKQAGQFMNRLAAGKKVRLENDPTGDQVDRYGRTLAYVYLSGSKQTLQEKMLAAGWAEVYVFGGRKFSKYQIFQEASEEGKEKAAGVWGQCAGNFHSAG